MRPNCILLFLLLFFNTKVTFGQQFSNLSFGVAAGNSLAVSKVNNQFEYKVSEFAVLSARPGLSVNFNQEEKSSITNLLYRYQLSFYAVYRLKESFFMQTGLEFNGRYFSFFEYPLLFREQKKFREHANRVSRSIPITSVPLLFGKVLSSDRSMWSIYIGPVANFFNINRLRTSFYQVGSSEGVFLTTRAGVRTEFRKGMLKGFGLDFSIDLGHENILNELVTVNSEIANSMNRKPVIYNTQFDGTAINLKLSYFLDANRLKRKGHSLSNNERPVKVIKEVITIADTVKLCLKDDGVEDGDSVRVEINGVTVIPEMLLRKENSCFQIPLIRNRDNKILIHATNLGNIYPNTGSCSLYLDSEELFNSKIQINLSQSASISIQTYLTNP